LTRSSFYILAAPPAIAMFPAIVKSSPGRLPGRLANENMLMSYLPGDLAIGVGAAFVVLGGNVPKRS
jgi:hypothetical protein